MVVNEVERYVLENVKLSAKSTRARDKKFFIWWVFFFPSGQAGAPLPPPRHFLSPAMLHTPLWGRAVPAAVPRRGHLPCITAQINPANLHTATHINPQPHTNLHTATHITPQPHTNHHTATHINPQPHTNLHTATHINPHQPAYLHTATHINPHQPTYQHTATLGSYCGLVAGGSVVSPVPPCPAFFGRRGFPPFARFARCPGESVRNPNVINPANLPYKSTLQINPHQPCKSPRGVGQRACPRGGALLNAPWGALAVLPFFPAVVLSLSWLLCGSVGVRAPGAALRLMPLGARSPSSFSFLRSELPPKSTDTSKPTLQCTRSPYGAERLPPAGGHYMAIIVLMSSFVNIAYG